MFYFKPVSSVFAPDNLAATQYLLSKGLNGGVTLTHRCGLATSREALRFRATVEFTGSGVGKSEEMMYSCIKSKQADKNHSPVSRALSHYSFYSTSVGLTLNKFSFSP